MKTTKELAIELGLVRKHRTSHLGNSTKRRKTDQVFSHLIIVDFESTCWEKKGNASNEIIEFPAVVLNTATGAIDDEFHYYVQPQENPTLSDFCRNLTGISQDQVDDGIPLSLCLKKFNTWLNKCAEKNGFSYMPGDKRCSVVTWSDWDIGTCLFYESRRKQLRIPPSMNSWIDLRATYRKFYERRPNGLNGALQDLGIEFEGREHSGIVDARNTARLTWKMICDGCIMQTTKSLPNSNKSHVHPVTASKEEQNFACCDKKTAVNKMDLIEQKPTSHCTLKSHSLHTQVRKTFAVENASTSVKNLDKQATSETCRVSAISKDNIKMGGGINLRSNSDNVRPVLQKQDINKFKSPVYKIVSTNLTTSASHLGNWKSQAKTTPGVSVPVNYTKLKTPSLPVSLQSNSLLSTKSLNASNESKFITPLSSYNFTTATKQYSITPPMCECGKRTRRKFVQSPGPNMGRCFYSCPNGRRSNEGEKNGCSFFKWEADVMGSCKVIKPTSTVVGSSKRIGVGAFARVPQPDFDDTLSVGP